jgi:hypothetical protein
MVHANCPAKLVQFATTYDPWWAAQFSAANVRQLRSALLACDQGAAWFMQIA